MVRITRVGTLYDMYVVSPPVSPTCTRAVRIKGPAITAPQIKGAVRIKGLSPHFFDDVYGPRVRHSGAAISYRRVAREESRVKTERCGTLRGDAFAAERRAPRRRMTKTSGGNAPLGKTAARSDVARQTCHASESSRDTAQRKRRVAVVRNLAAREIRRDARRNVCVA